MNQLDIIFNALNFAAEKHKLQRRKGNRNVPYINHLIQVTGLLASAGENDTVLLLAAILHDSIEDTDTSPEEISRLIGKEVLGIVLEVTDDKSLAFQVRKDKQIEKAPFLSEKASKIKLADKICNIRDVMNVPPDWTIDRKIDYLKWCEKVVAKLRYRQPVLYPVFYTEFNEGIKRLELSKL